MDKIGKWNNNRNEKIGWNKDKIGEGIQKREREK